MDPNKAKLRGDRLVRSLLVGHTIDLLIAGTLVLALLGTGYFEVREYRDYREKVSSRALRADLFQAAALASRLSSAFLDLGFVASSVSGESRPSRHPSSSMQKAFRIFLALHPALVDLEIFDPRTGKSLWTNRFPSASLSGPGRRGAYATPLSSNPSFLVGKSRLSARIGGRILPLAILLPLTKGHPPLGVRTYLRVEALRPPSLASPFSFILRDSRNGDMMLLSRGERPDSPLLPSPGSRVRTPVSGYPFTLEASWPSSLVREGWMEEASRRWMVEEGGLFLMLLMAGGIRILVRRQERQGEELSELSAFDEAIFDSAGAIGMVIDENGEIQRLNRAAREFMGVTLSEVRGRPYYWERFLPDWMRPGIRDFVLQMKDETRPVHHQNPWITPSGSFREFEWTSTVLRDREGRFLSLVTLGLDVTERMTLERELEEKNLRLGRLLAFDALRGRVAEAVSRATKEGEILPEFCRLSLEVPEIRMAWVGRPDEEGIFRPIASSGETDYLEGLIISVDERRPEGRGPMGQSWRSGAPVYSESFSENPAMAPWRDRGARSGFLASASLPVRRNGTVWAVLTVYFDRKKPFETEICNLLEAIADNLSLALDRLDLAERERKATALKETLLANTSAGIDLVRYPERVVVEVNRGFLEILGYREAAEIVGHHVQDLYFVEDESFRRMGEAAAEALATGSSRLRDLRIRRADGTEGFVDLSGAKIREADHETIVWTIVDVTERPRLARELSRLSDSNLLLAQINQAIVEAATEDSLLRAICDLSVRYGKLRMAWIGRPEEEKFVNVYASSGETAFLEGLEISVDPTKNGPVGEVWRTGVPSFNIDLERTFAGTSLAEKAFRHGLKSAAVLPVMREGAIWGILALYHEEAGGFFPPLTEVFSELARDISRGLDRLESLRREREMATLENVLLENTLAGILFQEQRVIRYANDRMRQMLGYESSGEMVGRSTRMLYADTGEYERVGFAYTLLPSRESVEIPDVRMVTRSGQPVMVDLSLARIPGEPSKVVVTVYDVTDRHAQTERLRLLSAYNTLLAHAGEALSSSSDEPSLLKNLCDLAVRDGEMAVSAIGRAEDGKGVAWLGASGKTGFLEGLPFFAGSGDPGAPDLLSRAFSGRRPVFGFAEDPVMGPWRDRAREFGIKAMGALPIFRKGEVWGVLLVGHGTQRVFEDPVLEGLLNELARTISHGLDRLDLLARQNLLSSAVAAVGEGVVITGPDSRVIFANDGFAAITGYSASEMVGENCRILQGEATDPATVGEIRRALREGRPFHGQILNYRKDKTPFWNLLSISPVRNSSGEIVEFVGNQRDITSLIDLTKRLEYDSRHDRLTGLPNRRALDLEFDKVLARSRRYGWPFAVAILDLDGFKPVNDRYGHEAGDRLLRLTGERILGALRKTDFLARQGGDEFVLLLENVGLQEELGVLLERIERQVRMPLLLEGGEEVSVGVSIGVALSSSDPEAPENPEILLRRADQALYESKNHKSDRSRSWVVHGETVPLARTLPQRLLSERRVEVHYQPVLDNRTGRIAGIEALARLRDPGGRILMPAEILPDYGADDLFELSRQVLERSLSDLAGLLAIDPSLWLSVNIDPRSVSEGCFDCLGRML
ncbi:MAG: Diguanylate cyclase/phosphodiesterase with PAS/PAC and GAF sensor(S), partial [Leptospirillum sp. Group IV 'UBA BS']